MTQIKDCCQANSKTKKCQRKDGKEFDFPRRFSKEKCLTQPIRGYSMISSCAPFVNCHKNKSNKSNKSKKSNKSNKSKKSNKSNKSKKSNKSRKQKGGQKQLNMLGNQLKVCSLQPLTGYQRDGYCKTLPGDIGKHLVCAKMTPEFLSYTKDKGNDLSSVVKEGEKWCLCEDRWLEAYQAKKSPPVIKKATNRYVNSKIQKKIKLASSKRKRKTKRKNNNL